MIRKYRYGTPFNTEALTEKIETTEGILPYGEVSQEEGFVFTYIMDEDDIVYGLGEANRGINKRGYCYISNCTDDPVHTEDKRSLYGAHNFIIVSGKTTFGLFFDYPSKLTFDIGYDRADTLRVSCENADLDIYVLEGENAYDIVKQFRHVIGRSYIPPKFAFGFGQSRWGYTTKEDFRTVAKGYRENHIPIDMIYMDIDYMQSFKDFTVNEENFPDFPEFVQEMDDQNIRLIPIIDAGVKVEPGYEIYEEGVKNNYFCKREDGSNFVAAVWPGDSVYPDFGQPKVRKWWAENQKFLTDIGVAGVWNDMNEPASFHGELPSDVVFTDEDQKSTHAAMHNVYGHLMSRATYEGLKEQTGKRPFVITRACYAGSQKYTTVWTGDNQSLWSHLQMAVPQLCNLGLSGLAFAGTDVGGFGADCTAELLCRWVQVGAFSPLFRNHSSNGSIYQEPWQFGEKTVNIYRKFVELRYRLLPYLYDLFAECEKTGLPIMRPLVLHYEKDENTWNLNDEFLVGEHLLVAPVLEQGQTKKMVYLPEGIWYDFNTGKRYEGKQYYLVDAPLDTCPMFAKAGSMIPAYEVVQYVGEKPYDTLNMLVFPGEGTYVHYQDNGSDFAYQDGAYNEYAFTQQENGEVTMKMGKEGYEKPYKKIEYIFVGQ